MNAIFTGLDSIAFHLKISSIIFLEILYVNWFRIYNLIWSAPHLRTLSDEYRDSVAVKKELLTKIRVP